MRILTTHKKKIHPAWRRRVELLEDWDAATRKNWRVRRSALSRLCGDLRWAWKLFRASRMCDALVTGSERPALILALMQKLARGQARVPHVLLECMWNLPEKGFGRWKRRLLLHWVAASTDRIIVYARHQIDEYADILDVPRDKFAFVLSHSTLYEAAYTATEGDYIFSGGYTNRDYATLFEAVRGLSYRTVVCVGSRQHLSHDIPPNVEVRENLSEDAFNRLMAACAFVVVPLRGGVLESGGRQVFQNAMAMGKAVIVTDLSATDYITHGLTGLLVPPGNAVELRDAIVTLTCNHTIRVNLGREARRVSAEFTPERFFERLFAVIEGVVPQPDCIVPIMPMRFLLAKVIFAARTPPIVQKAVQRLIGGPRLETVQFSDGHLFDCNTSEKYYWFRDSYEVDERRALEACLTPGSVLFDVGAHVGFWEVVLASKCRHIFAFEPSVRNFTRLTRNISQNHIENVTLVRAAASDQPGTLHLVEDGSMSHVAEYGAAVDAVTLDDYVSKHVPPDIVKIDIEGYAAAALKGMWHTISEHRPMLFIELHNHEEVAACLDLLDEFEYRSLPLDKTSAFPYRSKFIAQN